MKNKNRTDCDNKIVIPSKDIKISEGHKDHITGTGPHKDKKRDKKTRRQEDKNESKT